MAKKVIAGIDIGGTKIALALETIEGERLSHRRLVTQVELGPQGILRLIVQGLEGMLSEAGAELACIGIGCAGPLDLERGLIMSPGNLPGWDEFPLPGLLEERLGAPAFLENDANAAALGEHEYGAGRNLRDMVYLTISTGIGGGVIVGGELVHGVKARAGEVGHLTVLPDGPRCHCGSRGCLEMLASGTAIARRARERMAGGAESSSMMSEMIRDGSELTARMVSLAALDGDRVAREVWDESVLYLSIGIANIFSLLAPEAVILGGGVSASGEQLLGPLRPLVRERASMMPPEKISIVRAALGAESGLCGAVVVARRGLGAKG